MSLLLQSLYLAPVDGKAPLTGLVGVRSGSPLPETIAEQVAVRQAKILGNEDIDYIFFRRFHDGRSSKVAAYVLDNSDERFDELAVAEINRKVWLNGIAPLLYVAWPTHVDVLTCAAGPTFWDDKTRQAHYRPTERLEVTAGISKALEAQKLRFSALRLSNGTFWDDEANASWANSDQGSHQRLIQAVIATDREWNGNKNPLMRHLLLLTILAKYLEDRKVFPGNWFSTFHASATNFLEVLSHGSTASVKAMLHALQDKFNGDIFELPANFDHNLTKEKLQGFVELLEAKTIKKQRYLWEQYGFAYIPVEVLSHLYQHFAQSGKGAVFTPPFVASLMLDYALPYETITGDERILDPTCGSGVFLVGAFRRLVHVWQSKNDWKRPGVSELKRILERSIFGAELQEEAAHLAAFNLALAICDALQPEVIWEHLRFEKLVGKNILVGDLFENLEAIRSLGGENGYTTILGNPPFLSKLTKAAISTRPKKLKKIPIPDGQIAYRVAEEGMSLLGDEGRLCLIQNAGFLYNEKTKKFQKHFLQSHQVNVVLDFVSIRNLFEGADPKTVALVVTKKAPSETHRILHLTFRRTVSVHERIGFELDHYDRHWITQETAETHLWAWKSNLLGGGRLLGLGKRMKEYQSFKEYFSERKWDYGEGFIAAKSGRREKAEWLTGKPCLPTKNLMTDGIKGKLEIVKATEFRSAYTKSRYSGPIIMLRAHETLPCAYRSKRFLAFRDKIIGIHADAKDEANLKHFYTIFLENRQSFRALLLLFSTQVLLGKSTAVLKRDIDELPAIISKEGLELAWWEQYLCEDLVSHFAEFVRRGQNSQLLRDTVDDNAFKSYSEVFVKLLGSVYQNLRASRFGISGGLAYHAFCFGDKSEVDWPENWAEHLREIVFVQQGEAFRNNRIVRFYESNTMVIIKPDRLRHWIRSTAIRDADETLIDLRNQGY